MRSSTCILLFARSAHSECIVKNLPRAEILFELAARRAIAAARALGIDLVVSGSAPRCLPAGTTVIPQGGRSFGERFELAFREARRLGYQRIIAVGNDTPGLRTSHISSAVRALERHPLVLGPSHDGGVYLIGASVPIEERFGAVRWNARSTMQDLAELAGAFLLERLADVDGGPDVDRLEAGGDRLLARVLASIRDQRPPLAAIEARRAQRITKAHAIRGPPR